MNQASSITDDHKKNLELEGLLSKLNGLLSGVRATPDTNGHPPPYPVIFIVGAPRSGTTLLSQWLASLGIFSYPTNFISRFHANPYVGALVQDMLFDKKFQYKEELQLTVKSNAFHSDIGKTSGPLEPNSFYYFWRNHFKFPEIPGDPNVFMQSADFGSFMNHIDMLATHYKKPFFIKSIIINWYIEIFYQNVRKPLFIFNKRELYSNAHSLLKVRKKYFANEHNWYSFKPTAYPLLAQLDNYAQVVGQVHFTNLDISRALEKIPEQNKLEVSYKELCTAPKSLYNRLISKMAGLGHAVDASYSGVERFDYQAIDPSKQSALMRAVKIIEELSDVV